MKPFTIKQLNAILTSKFGTLTNLVRSLADSTLREIARNGECEDDARRTSERLSEYTEVRPEHERLLIVLCPPLGKGGLPAVEVYADRRVKVKIIMEGDNLPLPWESFKEGCPVQQTEVACVPEWLYQL